MAWAFSSLILALSDLTSFRSSRSVLVAFYFVYLWRLSFSLFFFSPFFSPSMTLIQPASLCDEGEEAKITPHARQRTLRCFTSIHNGCLLQYLCPLPVLIPLVSTWSNYIGIVFVYMCAFVFGYVFICIYVHVCLYMCLYAYLDMHLYVHVFMFIRIRMSLCVLVFGYVGLYVY
jgi:hypothetical protein